MLIATKPSCRVIADWLKVEALTVSSNINVKTPVSILISKDDSIGIDVSLPTLLACLAFNGDMNATAWPLRPVAKKEGKVI